MTQVLAVIAEYAVIGAATWFAVLFPLVVFREVPDSSILEVLRAVEKVPYAVMAVSVVYLTGGIVNHGTGFIFRYFEKRILFKVYEEEPCSSCDLVLLSYLPFTIRLWSKRLQAANRKVREVYEQHQSACLFLLLREPHFENFFNSERHVLSLYRSSTVISSVLFVMTAVFASRLRWETMLGSVFFAIASFILWHDRQRWFFWSVRHSKKVLDAGRARKGDSQP